MTSDDNGVLAFFEYVLFPVVAPNSIKICGREFRRAIDLKEAFEAGTVDEFSIKNVLKVCFLY